MISVTGSEKVDTKIVNNVAHIREVFSFVGLSTDTKPTGTYGDAYIGNGSTYFAMNTSTVYMYDEANSTWHEL